MNSIGQLTVSDNKFEDIACDLIREFPSKYHTMLTVFTAGLMTKLLKATDSQPNVFEEYKAGDWTIHIKSPENTIKAQLAMFYKGEIRLQATFDTLFDAYSAAFNILIV